MLNLNNPNKPLGVFLFTGPSGVGKTHMAQSIAELFFGSKEHFTVLNMSEFKSGIYLVHVISDEGTKIMKVLKQ